MIKKIVSLLCLVSIIASMVPGNCVFAEESTGEQAAVLQSLGIHDAMAGGVATNDYLLKALSGFLYEEGEKPSPEDFARATGILNFGDIYDGSKTVTRNEAIEYTLATLGYKAYAESTGDGGIKTMASSLGVSKGLTEINDEPITIDECVVMLHNMLEVEPMSAIYSEGKVKHIIENDQTLLSKYRNVHKIKGMLTADGMTSLDSEKACADGYIRIDSSLYAIENNILDDNLLGKGVEAYVRKDDDGELVVLCVYEKAGRNNELVIDAKDIESVTEDFLRLDYYVNNRLKKAKIADVPRVIYNGVFYGDYDAPDFKPESGNVRLLDNNNDNKYDVIFINSYETVVVDAVDLSRKIIHNKFKSTGNIASIKLDTEKTDVKYTITDTFEKLELTDIKNGDILLVAKSKSADNVVYEILVSDDAFVGKLQSINEREMMLLIDDEEYPFTGSFLRYRDEEGNLNLGNTYKFFTDALGNVAYWEKVTEDGYAVIERIYKDWEKDRLFASYMNMDGVWIDAPIAKKFTYKEQFYSRLDVDTAFEMLKDIKSEVVKLTFNQDEEIKIIETAKETATADKNRFTKTSNKTLSWRSGANTFTDDSTAQCKYYLEDDTKLIILPASPDNYKIRAEYDVRDALGYFKADTQYTLTFYDVDEFGFSKMVAMRYTAKVRNTLFIVTDIKKILDEGEERAQATGYAGDFENFTLTGVDDETFDNVEKGEIVKVSVNSEGYVDYIFPVFKLSNLNKNDGSQFLAGRQYEVTSYMAGCVEAVAAGKNRLMLDINGTKYTYRLSDTASVQIYSPIDGIKSASIYDIMEQDKVFIRLSYGNIQQIIIHE